MTKQEIRQKMKALRAAVPEEERAAAEIRALDTLRKSGLLSDAREVNLYASFGDEFPTRRIKEWLLRHDYLVSVPVTEGKDMFAARVDFGTVYARGDFGIEVPAKAESVDKHSLDLVLLPGLAFDGQGYRVGYGKGYYDRFLAGTRAVRVGICYSFQLFSALPREPHDLAADFVLTEEGIYRSRE